MPNRIRCSWVCVTLLSALTCARACEAQADDAKKAAPAPAKLHSWEKIAYPDLPCPWATKSFTPSLHVKSEGEARGLELRLTFHTPGIHSDKRGEFVSPEPKQIQVRLHYTDGTVVDPKRQGLGGLDVFEDFIVFVGGSLGSSGALHRYFPWGKNDFQEAWIEVRVPGHVYWLGVPYGFTRNPADPLCASERKGEPKFAPPMHKLEKDARIVNWKYVEYELDPPHGGWELKLRQSNPFDAACVVVLSLGSTGPSDLHTPRTAVSIEQPELGPLTGRCWSIESIDGNRDGNRHDRFRFNTNGGSGDTRCWGTIAVKVDDFEARAIVPSSLFNYVHGVADPYHKATFR